MMNQQEKPLAWLGSSKKDLMALPMGVRKFFGHALDFAQRGERHNAAKVLKGFGGGGLKFREVVFVLHVFRKKSKSGIATPKPDMEIIRERLKVAEKLSREMRDE
jgi:phage-related protein